MKTHGLKTLPVYFDAVDSGAKTFEIRNNDRDFQTGDWLELREFDPQLVTVPAPWSPPGMPQEPSHDGYTGRVLKASVTYVFHDTWENFGLKKGYVVLGLMVTRDMQKELAK